MKSAASAGGFFYWSGMQKNRNLQLKVFLFYVKMEIKGCTCFALD